MTQFRLNFSIRVSASVSHPLKQWALDRITNNPASQTYFPFFAFVTATYLLILVLLAVVAVTIQDCSCSTSAPGEDRESYSQPFETDRAEAFIQLSNQRKLQPPKAVVQRQ